MQLKREIAGTSRIEGADFTDRELEAAMKLTTEQLLTRSQRQAHAAMKAYKWIAGLPKDRPVNCALIKEVHSIIIGDSDADNCPPGVIRKKGENVLFGLPPHRGCEGGEECEEAFASLGRLVQTEFREHDLLIQALVLHFHFAVMHPFLDGNGRTARAVEALMLQRSGLTDHLFIAMSNYYYDDKTGYLSALSSVSPPDYDLTRFLTFGLVGIKIQCERLFQEIRWHVSKSIYINTMHELLGRLQSPRKAVIARRHIQILNLLLQKDELPLGELFSLTDYLYKPLKAGGKARVRDLIHLLTVGAVAMRGEKKENGQVVNFMSANLDWPKEITQTGFMEKCKQLPKANAYSFLTSVN